MTMSKIISSVPQGLLEDVDPTEILAALHKRQVDTQKMIGEYRGVINDLAIEIEMLRDRVKKLEESK